MATQEESRQPLPTEDLLQSLRVLLGDLVRNFAPSVALLDDADIYYGGGVDKERGTFRIEVTVGDEAGVVDLERPLISLEIRPSPMLPALAKRLIADFEASRVAPN